MATLEGTGTSGKQVDVSLEKDGKRVAVEISVTTRAEHEVENIRNDLEGGYAEVICLFASSTVLEQMQACLQSNDASYEHVRCGSVKDYASMMRALPS